MGIKTHSTAFLAAIDKSTHGKCTEQCPARSECPIHLTRTGLTSGGKGGPCAQIHWGHRGLRPSLGQSAPTVTGPLNFTPSTCTAFHRCFPKLSCPNVMTRWERVPSSPKKMQPVSCPPRHLHGRTRMLATGGLGKAPPWPHPHACDRRAREGCPSRPWTHRHARLKYREEMDPEGVDGCPAAQLLKSSTWTFAMGGE